MKSPSPSRSPGDMRAMNLLIIVTGGKDDGTYSQGTITVPPTEPSTQFCPKHTPTLDFPVFYPHPRPPTFNGRLNHPVQVQKDKPAHVGGGGETARSPLWAPRFSTPPSKIRDTTRQDLRLPPLKITRSTPCFSSGVMSKRIFLGGGRITVMADEWVGVKRMLKAPVIATS
eukprot:764864-Hanusia_phi.AAC.1